MTFPKGSMGAAALYYASLGWAVFPLVPQDKVPLIGKRDGGNGLHDATTDADQIGSSHIQRISRLVGEPHLHAVMAPFARARQANRTRTCTEVDDPPRA